MQGPGYSSLVAVGKYHWRASLWILESTPSWLCVCFFWEVGHVDYKMYLKVFKIISLKVASFVFAAFEDMPLPEEKIYQGITEGIFKR